MKANEIKKGMVIDQDNKNILIKKIFVQSPHSRGGSTLYKMSGSDISSGQKFERSFKGDEVVTQVEVSRREVQLLFSDSQTYTFRDIENYEQYMLAADTLEEEAKFLYDGLSGLSALISDGQVLGIILPAIMTFEVTECSPSVKGGSASARTKPATLSTGLVVQVPEYLSVGESIKVNTDLREFVSRA